MNKAIVVLLGLATALAPALPSLAQTAGDDRSFEGEHWALEAAPALPGALNLTVVQAGATLADEIELPGDNLTWDFDDDRADLATGVAAVRADDRERLRLIVDTEDNTSVRIQLADGVDATDESDDDGDRYRLALANGTELVLTGESISLDGQTATVAGDALIQTAEPGSVPGSPGEEDRNASRDAPANRSDDDADENNETAEPDDTDRRAESDDESRSERSQASEQRRQDRGPPTRNATQGPYEVGDVSFTLANDTLQDVRLKNTSLFTGIELPGLIPAEERQRGPQLSLDGERARAHIVGAEGMAARLESDAGVDARLAEDIEIRQEDESLFLSVDSLLVVVQGDDLELEERTITADELRINARVGERAEDAVWRAEDAPTAAQLPYDYEGRYVEFTLAEDGLRNLTVHGTPLGEVGFAEIQVDEIDRRGAHLAAEGEDFELRVEDTPAAQLSLEVANLSSDLPRETTLPSEARVTVDLEEDELRLRVDRPADVLSNETAFEHEPPSAPVERSEGPNPGLTARSEDGQFGLQSKDAATLAASFAGELNGTEGNVSLELGLARAMLIDDTNGNGRVDVGEPAIAERGLANGTVDVENDALVSTFPLWSGNLTVTVEPGDDTAKVTYEAHNLSAPPETLFVLETRVQAPPGAQLTPTDSGVEVRNGSMTAAFSATGPVTVDGSDAWAQRSIFVDSNDTVRVLLAYPAGDDIVHDPTLAVQSIGAAQAVQQLAASPYAIIVGAGLAGALVAGTVIHRRRKMP